MKSEAIRRKSFEKKETTSLLCPPERLVQTHKLSMVVKAMICALQRVLSCRGWRGLNSGAVYEPPHA